MTVVQRQRSSNVEVRNLIAAAIDGANDELRRINLEIWNNPEVMFEEVKACKLITDWLEARGWAVERGVYGIKTAFEARFSVRPGGRTQVDALPEIGHACGHNLIATSSLASAVGVSAAMTSLNLPGTVVLMGTPAEETGGGKYIMANNGAWKDCDACIMTHGMPQFSTPVCITKASWKFRAKFHGKASHAAAAPWNGRNACDAIVMAYNGIGLLRQQISKSDSIQGVILSAGKAPNIIPDFSEGSFSLRSNNAPELELLRKRIIPVFEGAAATTGCTVELFWDALYEDVVTNMTLAERYRQYMITELGMRPEDMVPLDVAAIKYEQNGSSDMGNCTYITPGIQAMFRIDAQDMPHTPLFQKASGTDFSHAEALRAGKANAFIGIDVLIDDAFYGDVHAEWKDAMQKAGRL
ncbi:putative amidohydrolase amhX [Coleophoma cylindrospora]|uniref:Peptidase M20 domain-containing protein 2 n=1 Tax=Coleophoma cylindrospora TaxID=1849047 RepID=A0A3D8S7Q1_9HELO|nr:putative amidohydrolase amhX [Coleophoma cylindrospora]